MSHEVIKSRIIAKHDEVIRKARELFPAFRYAPECQVYFFETSRNAGIAHSDMRCGYNVHVFAQDLERFLTDTVPHEVAHIVCLYTRTDMGHGASWKRVCRMLGGNGQRCTSAEGLNLKAIRHRKRYQYRATCGTMVMVSDVIHGKIQRTGKIYRLARTCGRILAEHFTGHSE